MIEAKQVQVDGKSRSDLIVEINELLSPFMNKHTHLSAAYPSKPPPTIVVTLPKDLDPGTLNPAKLLASGTTVVEDKVTELTGLVSHLEGLLNAALKRITVLEGQVKDAAEAPDRRQREQGNGLSDGRVSVRNSPGRTGYVHSNVTEQVYRRRGVLDYQEGVR